MVEAKIAKGAIEPCDDISSSTSSTSLTTDNPASNDEPGLWKELRTYPKVAAFCVGLNCAALIVGYDLVIVGQISALPTFRRDFGSVYRGKYIIPSMWLSLWSAMGPVGQMAGSMFGGWAQDRYGRRTSLLIGSIISAVAVAVCYTAKLPDHLDSRRGLFLTGKTIQGVSLGIMLATSQTIVSEITSRTLRGPANGLISVQMLLGQLIGALVIRSQQSKRSVNAYLIPLASQWPFSVVLFVVAILVPESPAWLIRMKRPELALKALSRLHTASVHVQSVMDDLTSTIAEENEAGGEAVSFADCFKGVDRRRTWIIIFANTITVIFGISLLGQTSYFLQIVGMKVSTSLNILIAGIVLGGVSNVIAFVVMQKIGRRTPIILSLGVSVLLWLGMGIAGCWAGNVTVWYTAATMLSLAIVNGLGSWPASYAVAGETSSLRLRARSQGIGWLAHSFALGTMAIVLPYIFNPDSGDLGAKTGFVYSGLCLMGTAVAWWLIPEMKGRSSVEIDRMFSLGVGTRDFRTWGQGLEHRSR